MPEFKIKLEAATAFLSEMPVFDIRTKSLQPAAQAFMRNVDRLALFAKLPPSLMGIAALLQDLWCNASHAVTGQTNIHLIGDKANDVLLKYAELLNKATDRGWHEGNLLWQCQAVCKSLAEIEEGKDEFLADSLKIFLAAQTILAWTIFETVAGDLWIAAVNEKTSTLGKQMAQYKEPNNKESVKSIKLDILERHGFDLRGKLGTAFAYKFDFGKLDSSRTAYSTAFGKDSEMLSVFDNPQLKALRLTRNVLVHQGGKADKTFADRVKSTGTFPEIKVNDDVIISYKEASDFSGAAVHSAERLFIFVDKWLQSNPD